MSVGSVIVSLFLFLILSVCLLNQLCQWVDNTIGLFKEPTFGIVETPFYMFFFSISIISDFIFIMPFLLISLDFVCYFLNF